MSLEEKYKEYTNKQLIKVIVKADDYQPEAVQIAKTIVSEREITPEERDEINETIEIEKKAQKEKEKKKRELEEKVSNRIKSIFNEINPLNKTEPNGQKIVKLVFWVFGILYLFQLYYDFPLLISLFTDPPKRFEWEIIFFLIGVAYLPASLYHFYRLKRIGWILMCLYMIHSFLFSLGTFISLWMLSNSDDSVMFYNAPQPNFTYLILNSFFYIGTIYLLLKKQVTVIFSIDFKSQIYTLVLGSLGILISLVTIYYLLF